MPVNYVMRSILARLLRRLERATACNASSSMRAFIEIRWMLRRSTSCGSWTRAYETAASFRKAQRATVRNGGETQRRGAAYPLSRALPLANQILQKRLSHPHMLQNAPHVQPVQRISHQDLPDQFLAICGDGRLVREGEVRIADTPHHLCGEAVTLLAVPLRFPRSSWPQVRSGNQVSPQHKLTSKPERERKESSDHRLGDPSNLTV